MKQPALFPEPIIKNAGFSDCGKYRFWLSRIWDESLPKLMCIGLNPSRADAHDDDPTIESIIRISTHNGYGGIYMTNIFPFITPYPEQLKIDGQDKNVLALKLARIACDDVCFCWGAFKQAIGPDEAIKKAFPDALCMGKNKNGSPTHPLYLKGETELIKYNQ